MTPIDRTSTPPQPTRPYRILLWSVGPLLPLVALLALTALIYVPGLSGGFLFDDTPNIVDNPAVHVESLTLAALKDAATSVHAQLLSRPLSMVTFALNYWATGLDPYYFKLTNLVIHLVNGVLVYLLTRALLSALLRRGLTTPVQTPWLALTITAGWLLHPLNMSATLYVVQRMTSLAALFAIAGLLLYAVGRLRQLDGRPGAVHIGFALLLFGPLAELSKENGALLPFLMFVVEAAFFRFAAKSVAARRGVVAFQIVVAALPALLVLGFLATHMDWLRERYLTRDFTLGERLLTQARVLFFYLRLILVPDISAMGLYHDDISLSHSLLDPPVTLAAVLGIAALAILAIATVRRAPVLSFGLAFFFVGHSLESSVLSLEIAHEHRNYLPSYSVLFCLFYYLLSGASGLSVARVRRIAAMMLLLFLAGASAVRASYWENNELKATIEARNHPDSARSLYELGIIYFNKIASSPSAATEYYPRARDLFERDSRLDPYNPSGLFGLIHLNGLVGLPPERRWLDELQERLRERPFAQFVAQALRKLNSCHQINQCDTLTSEQLQSLFDAALGNPTLTGWLRARVLTEVAVHTLHAQGAEAALEYARAAVQLEPETPQHHLNVASLLFQAGQLAEAQNELARVERMPLTNRERERLASVKAAVASTTATNTTAIEQVGR